MFKRALILLLVAAIIQVASSQELREMQWEEVPSRVIPDMSYAGKSILVVESTILKLGFESSKGILEVQEKGSGVWWVVLKPGVQLISISADGYSSLNNQRIFPQPKQALQIKITPKQVLGAYGGFDESRPEIRLNNTPTLGTAGTEEWYKRRAKSRLLSLVIPSSGQFISGQYIRGGLYSVTIIGSLTMAYLAQQDHADAKSEYDNALTDYRAATEQTIIDQHYARGEAALNDMNNAKDQMMLFTLAAGSVYALQLIDAWIWGGGKRPVSGKYSSMFRSERTQVSIRTKFKLALDLVWR